MVSAAEGDFSRLADGRRNVLGHAELRGGLVVCGHNERTARRRVRRCDHDPYRILRPADEVPVVLEGPARLHRVWGLPVDVGLPGHGEAGGTCGHVGRRDGEDLAVVGIRHFLALRGLVLLEIRRIRVVGFPRESGDHDCVEIRGAIPAPGRRQRIANPGIQRVDRRRANLDDDMRNHVVLRLRVVVREHELALRTAHRPGRLVHHVAECQHLRDRRIVVEPVHDVRYAPGLHPPLA